MQSILIFVIFLGPLVFFHELGHFLFARLFGVRVETFSVGFGPKVLKFNRGGTDYAISLIPLGGYVKMFGDDPLSEKELTEEERKVAFTTKSKWARFWIVFGGPLANFIFAFVLYFSLLLIGASVPEPKFGIVPMESKYYTNGLRTGDVLKKVNDFEVVSFDDINIVKDNIESITVLREKKKIIVPINDRSEVFLEEFMSYRPIFRSPFFINKKNEVFKVFISKDTSSTISIEEMISRKVQSVYLYQVDKTDKEWNRLLDNRPTEILIGDKKFSDVILSKKLYPIDLSIINIVMGSPADKAKLKSDDVLINVNGESIFDFEKLRGQVQASKGKTPLDIKYLRNGKVKSTILTPEFNEKNKSYTIGVYSGIRFLQHKMIDTPSMGLVESTRRGLIRTWDGIIGTAGIFGKLVSGQVSTDKLGGPLQIGKVAKNYFDISLGMFFRLMALISINLGVINLFPIPVLDGGHILFICLELLNRGPLSRRKIQYAQQFGMILLFSLMALAIYNDVVNIFL